MKKKYFNTKTEFIQNHKHTDFKLILGYLSCAFALYGGYYGQVTPFNESKEITFIYIIFLGEKITSDTKERLTIHTNTKKYSDIYNITFEFHENNSSGKPIDGKCNTSKSFGNWFDVNGLMNTELFEKELANGLAIARSGKLHLQ
ncbi:41081_t:CDS:2 [Gigaspora margarita]|uniref:Signal peptidase complex subunit 2 n=1 Tax=Gigaspora margarita TaxID=4874 RepID=A0ABN7UXW6_GIGMA|nr:41081_t:CDS:2 [Gigaspora margarita]